MRWGNRNYVSNVRSGGIWHKTALKSANSSKLMSGYCSKNKKELLESLTGMNESLKNEKDGTNSPVKSKSVSAKWSKI
jgi:hypothetical protein